MAGPAWPSLRRGPKLIQSHRLVRWLHTASWSRHFIRLTSVFCIIARTQQPAGAGLRRRTHSDRLRGFKSSPHKSALNLVLTLPALHCTDDGYEPMPPHRSNLQHSLCLTAPRRWVASELLCAAGLPLRRQE